ncbi:MULTISPECIES: hypothetical protein [Paenibacillus]|uniref:Uncharacterized protein n=2 Tax=Paenibacillus TaxID=44249 RepID=A0ABU1QIR7_9BACL|nr:MULTISPECIES: hypothetical protein [Paenibacillus]KAF6630664.1 hypothetical protein H6F38_14650 [Paenibacillus sp. EKM208P]MDR6779534.1 hypothetical protein [Paenibacillus peoriae]
MQLSHEAQTLLDICWVDGDPRSTTFIIGEKTNFKGTEFKPNEETYNELLEYQSSSPRPYKIEKFGKFVNLTGRKVK